MKQPRILLVDASGEWSLLCRRVLESSLHEVRVASSPGLALEHVTTQGLDLVMADVTLPEASGFELCRRIRELRPALPVVMISRGGDMDTVIDALRAGAVDFLKAPFESAGVLAVVVRALSANGLRGQRRGGLVRARAPGALWCEGSAVMQRLNEVVTNLSTSLASVLLQGETGTGKEVIARAIHRSSSVARGPLVAVNCSAMPAGLLESSLFGHTRGAFTDARRESKGLFLEANGGTLLLDEIGELPLELQPKLLRALQERTVRPLGGHAELPFDCRLITATNRDLEQEVAGRRFREDLYYRLDVVRITVPPLRERGDDVLTLARSFASTFAAALERTAVLSPPVERVLLDYDWPGNVRELENCMEHAVTMARGQALMVADLPSKVRQFEARLRAPASDPEASKALSLDEIERHHILRAMQQSSGNRSAAARSLGIDRRTLQRRLKAFAAEQAVRH